MNYEIIEIYLKREHGLSDSQLKYELSRFERHCEIGLELAKALKQGKFPSHGAVSVCVKGVCYTAQMLYVNGYAQTIYASYSLLTQIIEHPQTVNDMKRGFKIK